jgi:hypothetical protein
MTKKNNGKLVIVAFPPFVDILQQSLLNGIVFGQTITDSINK